MASVQKRVGRLGSTSDGVAPLQSNQTIAPSQKMNAA
jgi:hypothetical protein